MELTKKEAVRLHKEMWQWIAYETLVQKRKIGKREWFKKFMPDAKIRNHSFCCEYAEGCFDCLVEWPNHNCIHEDAFFTKWLLTKSWEEAAELARQIAELPEK